MADEINPPFQVDISAHIKKECYQAAVKIVDLTSKDDNFVELHKKSTALAKVLFEATRSHLDGLSEE
ncbi:MAG: hypothetical protein CMM50_11230 [Rhodospirillaceae bacterium]|nr:hypothetical protein [Rhodospirillaceae bacterium]|tara:strand:+ start:1195 stop:1395 length:201 start_codon:yes stop_codon:yes gene_type:complete